MQLPDLKAMQQLAAQTLRCPAVEGVQQSGVIPLAVMLHERRRVVEGIHPFKVRQSIFFDSQNDRTNDHLIGDQADAMPVHVGGQVILGQNVLLYRVDAIRYDHQLLLVLRAANKVRSGELVDVEYAVLNAAEQTVTKQVVLFVGIQRTKRSTTTGWP